MYFLKNFLRQTIFKVFIKSIIKQLLFFCFFNVFIFLPWGIWDISSPTRNGIHIPYVGKWSFNHWTYQGSTNISVFIDAIFFSVVYLLKKFASPIYRQRFNIEWQSEGSGNFSLSKSISPTYQWISSTNAILPAGSPIKIQTLLQM